MLSITNWFYMQINLLKNSNMKIDVRQKSDNTETDTVLSDKFNNDANNYGMKPMNI